MDRVLELVKSRIRQPGSPVRTVKAVAEAIDMSESGFYRMVERGTYKLPTLIALSRALEVEEDYFTSNTSKKTDSIEKIEPNSLEGIVSELKILREQLQVKDRQIELKDAQISGLLKTVDALVGKYEGADLDQLLTATGDVDIDLPKYQLGTFMKTILPIFLPQSVTK